MVRALLVVLAGNVPEVQSAIAEFFQGRCSGARWFSPSWWVTAFSRAPRTAGMLRQFTDKTVHWISRTWLNVYWAYMHFGGTCGYVSTLVVTPPKTVNGSTLRQFIHLTMYSPGDLHSPSCTARAAPMNRPAGSHRESCRKVQGYRRGSRCILLHQICSFSFKSLRKH
jgi:hypothetical protein